MKKYWVAQKQIAFILTCTMFTIGVEVQREGDRTLRPVLEIWGEKAGY